MISAYHAKYYAHELTRRHTKGQIASPAHVTEKSKFMRSGQAMTNQQNPKFQEFVAKLRQIEPEFLQPMFSVEEV